MMDDNRFLEELTPEESSSRKSLRWLLFAIPIVLIVCFGIAIVGKFSFNFSTGGYSVEEVIMSSGLSENQEPLDIKDVFKPSDTIICTVKTSGIDGGIIGMKWYFGDSLFYEFT